MDWVRRLLNRPYRRARAAEGAGDYRKAAALYVEADMLEDAVSALLVLAARTTSFEERLAAYHDALRWLPPDHIRASEVEAQLGLTVLADARTRGARTAEERRRLAGAAAALERLGRDGDAATAFEILGENDAVARCLERAGEVERLEALLERTNAGEERDRKLRGFARDHELAMKVGARIEALRALESAVRTAPDDARSAEMLRRLEARFPPPYVVDLNTTSRALRCIGKLPVTLGRVEADLSLRGASVSRAHAELGLSGDARITIRDLGSRNGTLVRGVALSGAIEVSEETEVGLGEDVTLAVSRVGAALRIEVVRGIDRGLVLWAGTGPLSIAELGATIDFPEGRARVTASPGAKLTLDGQLCAAPITVLVADAFEIDGVTTRVGGDA